MKRPEVEKCVVVGNAPTLLENKNGSLFDSYDVIVRCNLATIKNFEEFVGSRTDYRIINYHVYNHLFHAEKKMPKDKFQGLKVNSMSDIISNDEILFTKDHHRDLKMRRLKNIEERLLNEHSIRAIMYNMPIEAMVKHNLMLDFSCGAYAVALSTYLFPNAEVDVYGFSFYKGIDKRCSHYYEDVQGKVLGHDYSKEEKRLRSIKGVNFK